MAIHMDNFILSLLMQKAFRLKKKVLELRMLAQKKSMRTC